jgi:hypothetical protein
MAEVTQQQILPAPFIEAAAKPYLQDLTKAVGGLKAADLSQSLGRQFIAGQDPLQAQAQQVALGGIGAYQPFLNQAQAAQTQAGVLAGQAGTQAGLAGQFVGPQAYQQFMSPYQQDIIDTTLAEFDVQAQKGIPGIAAQAVSRGVLGGGREGVMRSEYQSTSDRNRAALQAQLLQQGFGQAQQAAGQAFSQQQALANQQAQLAQAQLGLGSAAVGLGGQQQALLGQDVGALSTLGAQNQALAQAQLSADQQLAQAQLNQPLQAAQALGAGITGLIAGYPGQTQTQISPSPSLAQTALGTGATLAGIYRGFGLGG